jgi:hypothetical protein
LASGIKSSLDVLLGKSEDVTVIDAYLDQQSFEDRLDEYSDLFQKMNRLSCFQISMVVVSSKNVFAPYQVQYFSDHRDELSFGAAIVNGDRATEY